MGCISGFNFNTFFCRLAFQKHFFQGWKCFASWRLILINCFLIDFLSRTKAFVQASRKNICSFIIQKRWEVVVQYCPLFEESFSIMPPIYWSQNLWKEDFSLFALLVTANATQNRRQSRHKKNSTMAKRRECIVTSDNSFLSTSLFWGHSKAMCHWQASERSLFLPWLTSLPAIFFANVILRTMRKPLISQRLFIYFTALVDR